MTAHLGAVKAQHDADVAGGAGSVWLPDALAVKYPGAPWEWGWQWVFPATRHYVDRETGVRRRHHLHQSVLQRTFKAAVRESGLSKAASCHSLRHHADSRIMPTGDYGTIPTGLSQSGRPLIHVRRDRNLMTVRRMPTFAV